MASHRKELKLGIDKRDLVNFSVKAQDQILRAAAEGIVGGSYNTQGIADDLSPGYQQYQGVSKILNSLGMGGTNLTTQMSQQDGEPSKMMSGTHNKSIINEGGNDLLLPSIKSNRKQQQSPFKQNGGQNAFFDLPMMLATQKMMRQTVRAAEKMNQGASGHDFNTQNSAKISSPNETARHNSQSMRATQSVDRNMSVKMNPKVLETWINETLQDAEHLDIPGVILKPEHKNPISRYGIDRLALTNAGIPNELVDRIFRALFVYSVGFYELVKKCLQHTERRYSIITAIWKVFSILLEYCCKTDYRMLISEISKEHKDEIDRLEKEFQAKFSEQAANERILKQNMEILQKYTEELEKEKNSERQMRLKLEEEYMQNTKNHEEEVQLRLKFESKLNNMHSVHRDLETKYKRALSELAGLQTINEQLYNKTNAQGEEITALKTLKAEMESKINYNDEKIQGLNREVSIKLKQVQDLEGKFTSAQDELDLTKYKLQELQKDITENKLKIDVYESQVVGLKNEKQHLLLELKETKDLQKVYEKKCGTLLQDINKVNLEFQESKREIIGFGEIQKEREERLEKQKIELKELRAKFEDLDLRHGTLTIHHDKVKEQYETCKRDLDDAIEKLHLTNKVRHETELRLNEETERARSLQDVIRDKDDQLHKRAQEIEDLEKQVVELQRTNDNLEVKKASIERQAEVNKKQLSDKISNLNEILTSEKETREMWIERYEKEQKEHTQTNANLLNTKSQLKDQILATKNVEIKLQTTMKQNEVLTEQNTRLQDQLNEALASQENLERDVNTQKEIMKQMESNRKEYIQKLKSDLLSVESRFTQKIEYMEMVSQDFHSRAAQNLIQYQIQKTKYEETKATLDDTTKKLEDTTESLRSTQSSLSNSEMQCEDLQSQISFNILDRQKALQQRIDDLLEEKKQLEENIQQMQLEIEAKVKLENQLHDYLNEIKLLKSEMLGIKKERDKLQNIVNNHSAAAEEQRQEFEKQMQGMRPETQQSSAKEVIMMQTSGPQVIPEALEGAEAQPELQKQSSQTQSKPVSRASQGKGTPQASAHEIRQVTPQSAMNVKQITTQQFVKPQGREMQTQTDLRMSDIDRPQQPLVMRMQPNFVGNNNYNPTSNDIFKNQILTGNEIQQMQMQNQQNFNQVQSPMNQNQQIQQNQFNQQFYQNPNQGAPMQNMMMVDPSTGQQVPMLQMQQNQINNTLDPSQIHSGAQNDPINGMTPQYGLQIQTDFNNQQQHANNQTQLTSPYNQTQAFTNMGGDPNSTISSQQLGFNNTFNNGAAFSSTLQSPMNATQQFHQYQQQQQFQNQQNVIHEQAIEDDEYHNNMTNEQRSQHSQQSANQIIKQQNSSNNGTPMNRLQSNNRMQVDFKNMNTVMQKNPSLSQVSNNSGGSQQKGERKGTASQVSQKTPTGSQINNQYQPQVSQLSNPQMMQQQQFNQQQQQQQQQQYSQQQNYSPQQNQQFIQQQQQQYPPNQQMVPNQFINFQQNPNDPQQQQQFQNMPNQGYPQNMPQQQQFAQNQGQYDQQQNMAQQYQMMNQQQYPQQQQQYEQQQQYQQQQNPQYQQQYQQQYPQQQQMQQQVPQNQGNMMNQNNPQYQNNMPQVNSSTNGGGSVNQNQGGVPQFQNNQISQVQQQQQLNNNSQQMTEDDMRNLQMHQQQQAPQPHMRLKVDINSNSYAESQRKNLNSGGGMSVHTPMSQVSGYSQHLAPQNGRFQQQTQMISQQNNSNPNQLMVQQQPNNVIVNQNHQSGEKKDNRQVTGKSSIRTLIKAAATREY